MPKLLRILIISFPLLFLVFGASLTYLLVTNVEKPSEYVRRDYYLPLKSNVGTAKVNCFGFPAVMFSAYFLNRIAETGGRILLKKDLLVCDLDYSQLNSTVVRTVVNSTIWFQNPDAGDLTESITSQRSRVGLEEIEESIRYVPPEARTAVLDTMTKILSDVGKDTFTNIQSGAAILATRLIEPIMRKSMCA
jgi:hypothetical protein